MLEKNNIVISSTTIEDFNMISSFLNKICNSIKVQIESAEMSKVHPDYIICLLKQKFDKSPLYYIPNTTSFITNYNDGIYIFSSNLTLIIKKEYIINPPNFQLVDTYVT